MPAHNFVVVLVTGINRYIDLSNEICAWGANAPHFFVQKSSVTKNINFSKLGEIFGSQDFKETTHARGEKNFSVITKANDFNAVAIFFKQLKALIESLLSFFGELSDEFAAAA